MTPEDQEARKTRAQRLREQISRLITPAPQPQEHGGEEKPPPDTSRPGESAREFIERRMREEAADQSPGETQKQDKD